MKELKQLGVMVGLVVLVVGLGSCAAGFAVTQGGGAEMVGALRDAGIIILALLSLVVTLVGAAIAFGGAWAVARFGPKGTAAVRWAGSKLGRVESGVASGSERFVIRPLASTAKGITMARRLPPALATTDRVPERWRHEISGWRTFARRLRR